MDGGFLLACIAIGVGIAFEGWACITMTFMNIHTHVCFAYVCYWGCIDWAVCGWVEELCLAALSLWMM